MFESVLIANRGAIACRIERTLRRLQVRSIAVYSEADRDSLHVRDADRAVPIGAAAAAESYLCGERILQVALDEGADAIHPGYGFLSENAQFAEECERAGLIFIGPTPQQIRDFGRKHTARALAAENGVPLLPGTGLLDDLPHALAEAERIGYPLMLKSTAGGGGIGMQLCAQAAELRAAFDSVRRLAGNHFHDDSVYLERFVPQARHIEVQLFGDGRGRVVTLGERDCSLQRRRQKVIEETPAPNLAEQLRARLWQTALSLGRAVRYRSAGTVEFIVDAVSGEFYFLEVNTRLQVEHGVTEAVSGIDLVEWMVRLAAGELLPDAVLCYSPRGAALQVRLYAEDPARSFRPGSGVLSEVRFPSTVRVESSIESGSEVSPYYDPMLAKLIAHAPTRQAAIQQLQRALDDTRLYGIETNLDYVRKILRTEPFVAGSCTTRFLETLPYRSDSIEVLEGGTLTTVQQWPGRLRHWDVGVPPSGPMDILAFRIANRLLENAEDCTALELTVTGPTLRFACESRIALTGAAMHATLDGRTLPFWRPVCVAAGSVLKLESIEGAGQRAYLAVQGGFDVPSYLGSRATFTLGRFGGHAGRALRSGDVLRLQSAGPGDRGASTDDEGACTPLLPPYGHHWDIAVLLGPHAAPEFFTDEDMRVFFESDWEVHYHSSRTGVRLIGPKPQWARRDGGEAGLHPSNIHDNAYTVGAIDFTGDMPVILGPDGPSLGGFVCPAAVALAELWKIGQLRPGDRVRFHPISAERARTLLLDQDEAVRTLRPMSSLRVDDATGSSRPSARSRHAMGQEDQAWRAVLAQRPASAARPALCYRQSGEDNILIEYGEPTLDLALRFRVQALLERLRAEAPQGVLDLTPGVRSLQVHFDCRVLEREALLERLLALEEQLPRIEELEVDSRIVHLPLSWDDPATRLAIERYMRSVRADAPWCPSNIEFIRRINGLDSVEEVRQIVFDASYLVMGLGDVYLGAPVATPLDPRHRLITTKYNPARTWTPENAVGIGGAYLCVYGMEGPGGYQFVGRTVQMWNRYRRTAEFPGEERHLLRFFDQLRFFPVSAEELERLRADFPLGKAHLTIEPTRLRLRDYQQFLSRHATSIASFRDRARAAFDAERERWRERAQQDSELIEAGALVDATPRAPTPASSHLLPEGCTAVLSPVSGSVWQLNVRVGQRIDAGVTLLVIEAMKTEIAVPATQSGTVVELYCRGGQGVGAGQTLLALRA